MKITGEETLEEIDEAIKHLNEQLKDDRYGNRLDWRRKEFLTSSFDDFLEHRLAITEGKHGDSISTARQPD